MFIEVPTAKSVLSTTAADRNIAMLIHTLTRNNVTARCKLKGTQREYGSKPLKHSIVKLILVFKR